MGSSFHQYSGELQLLSPHLQQGDPLPNVPENALLLLSMAFCPYVHRVVFCLVAKGIIPFKLVNCNLNPELKPDFLTHYNNNGTVPTLVKHEIFVYTESRSICDYIDEWYPQWPLHPKDETQREKDNAFVDEFDMQFIPAFDDITATLSGDMDESELKVIRDTFSQALERVNNELEERQTIYLGGDDRPTMIDFLCWPWIERSLFLSVDHDEIHELLIPYEPLALGTYINNMFKQQMVYDIGETYMYNYPAYINSKANGVDKYDFPHN